MELYQLKTFATVAATGHLTKAAEQLFISQPAVSAQIRSLEDELGLTLFERTPAGMMLTPAGSRLLEHADKVLASAQDLRNAASALRGQQQGHLRIGTVLDPSLVRVGELLGWLRTNRPLVEIDLHQEVSGAAMEQVRDGRLDASFYFGDTPPAPLAFLRLRSINYRVAGPAAWRTRIEGANRETISSMPWILVPPQNSHRRMTEKFFSEGSFSPSKVIEADQEQVIANLVISGLGLSLVREEIALRERDAGRLVLWDQAGIDSTLWFIYRSARGSDPPVRALLEALSELWDIPMPKPDSKSDSASKTTKKTAETKPAARKRRS